MKTLPLPPEEYSSEYFAKMRDELISDDQTKMRRDQDNFVGSGSVCLQSPDGSWFKITVSNSGTLSATSVSVDSEYRPRQTSNPYV